MKVLLLNFVGGPGIPLLNIEWGPGVPLLNFRGSRAPLINFESGPDSGSRGPGSQGPGPTFTQYCVSTSFLIDLFPNVHHLRF